MKLGSDTLLCIVDIVRQGFVEGKDISQKLREIDLVEEIKNGQDSTLVLSDEYKKLNKCE